MFDCVVRTDLQGEIGFVSPVGRHWLETVRPASTLTRLVDLFIAEDAERFQRMLHAGEEVCGSILRVATDDGEGAPVAVRRWRLVDGRQLLFCLLDPGPSSGGEQLASWVDHLTGLPGRPAIIHEANKRLAAQTPFWFALFNIDKFRVINETFGVHVADALLVEAAKRLQATLPGGTWLGRMGGDEFACLWQAPEATLARDLDEVLLDFARPFSIDGNKLYLGATIGVACSADEGASDAGRLMAQADAALLMAKAAGCSGWQRYARRDTPGVDYSLVAAMHTGIEQGEFFLVYQPQYDLAGRLYGAEALMRWQSESLGGVSPGQFIPVAEQFGLISFLGRWALRVACHHLKQILPRHPGFLMSVNVSASQFGAVDFADQVLAAVAEAEVPATSLVLEITESTLMHNSAWTEAALVRLRQAGIRFSIDDFGTGFSSLAYLTRFPVSAIKVDKSFIDAVGSGDAAPERLVQAMINLAHSIDLKVVAEGVETDSQRTFLAAADCDILQGYLTGRPMPFDQLRALEAGV